MSEFLEYSIPADAAEAAAKLWEKYLTPIDVQKVIRRYAKDSIPPAKVLFHQLLPGESVNTPKSGVIYRLVTRDPKKYSYLHFEGGCCLQRDDQKNIGSTENEYVSVEVTIYLFHDIAIDLS